MDVRDYNRAAWDRCVAAGDRWTVPVDAATIAAARRGEWSIVLTPARPVPRAWFPEDLRDREVLCLASGGGQQGPVLAAAGARVTVLDNSPRQLEQDRSVAERERLSIATVLGDMADLSAFESDRFDLVVHPVSNLFVPDVRPVFREAFRVLRRGGAILTGISNPLLFCFDPDLEKTGVLTVKYPVPYSDTGSLTDEERRRYTDPGEPLVFGHTLEDQLGGQLDAGFVLTGFYEDGDSDPATPASRIRGFLATRAVKP